jgi:dTDP-4-dehydrorhamnose reductase
LTSDIAATITNIVEAVDSGRVTTEAIAGIAHYSAKERFTRYSLCEAFAAALDKPIDHIKSDPNPPAGAPRPYDCALDTSKLERLGLAAPPTPFSVGLRRVLTGVGLAVTPLPA